MNHDDIHVDDRGKWGAVSQPRPTGDTFLGTAAIVLAQAALLSVYFAALIPIWVPLAAYNRIKKLVNHERHT